jgi:hypothetical protein
MTLGGASGTDIRGAESLHSETEVQVAGSSLSRESRVFSLKLEREERADYGTPIASVGPDEEGH